MPPKCTVCGKHYWTDHPCDCKTPPKPKERDSIIMTKGQEIAKWWNDHEDFTSDELAEEIDAVLEAAKAAEWQAKGGVVGDEELAWEVGLAIIKHRNDSNAQKLPDSIGFAALAAIYAHFPHLRNLPKTPQTEAEWQAKGEADNQVERCRAINMRLNTIIWNLVKHAESLLGQPECKNATYNGNAFMATAVDSLRDSIASARAGLVSNQTEPQPPQTESKTV